jgi:hypothetical protein
LLAGEAGSLLIFGPDVVQGDGVGLGGEFGRIEAADVLEVVNEVIQFVLEGDQFLFL